MSNDQVEIFYENQALSESPAFVWSREIARQHKKDGTAYFVNHGRAMRLIERREVKPESVVHGTFRSAWHIQPSAGIPIWQMRKQRTAEA